MPIVRKIPVAQSGEIAAGQTKQFKFGFQLGLAYNDNGVVKAYVNACTHMGGMTQLATSELQVESEKSKVESLGTQLPATSYQLPTPVLRCVRHHAEFDPKTGERLAGQAPEGTRLKPIPLQEENGTMYAILELHDD